MSTSEITLPRRTAAIPVTFDVGTVRRVFAVAGLLLSMLMTNIDSSIVNVALPQLSRDLHVTAADTVWVATAFLLALSCCLPLAIGLADQLGRKVSFLIGTPIFTLASLLCALAPTLHLLVAGRVLQGRPRRSSSPS
ncbi:hypothetical protein GCM10025867_05390 [Frondihabitans sucicola]|uniref:Major facilitator superfamily (MFS) profile domain-containing protein n=1 Tax=Frondihabitans sucicola TaxID=1268041 RepID=A0ABN6XTN1_9MICO|nr:MFS transporter [Frondihabitans sucicola]BDZ48298.1 hypothetical protein GCM10025867_05390 [Frondihabitans sucicola]